MSSASPLGAYSGILAALEKRIVSLERAASRASGGGGGGGGANPPGTIIAGIWPGTEPPDGYLFFGQSILDADTEYPELWDAAPSGWKSGTTLTLPTMSDSVLMEAASSIGAKAGAMSHTLLAANLPAHAHDMSHDHDMSHNHAINHDHGSFSTSGTDGQHDHTMRYLATGAGGGGNHYGRPYANTAGTWDLLPGTSGDDGEHGHLIDVPPFSGTSGGASSSTTGGASATSTGNGPGTGASVDHTPAHLKVRFAIRAVP